MNITSHTKDKAPVHLSFGNQVNNTPEPTFTMKKIEIISPKYGTKYALIDDSDYSLVSKYNWCITAKNHTLYCVTSTNPRILMHRLIMNVANPKILIDHKDHDGLNCQKENLREATYAQNQQNRSKRNGASSSYLGVSLRSGGKKKKSYDNKWQASIRPNYGKRIHLGYFISDIEAAKSYDAAAIEYYGEFANLNFPLVVTTEPLKIS